jgi:hypothetical protein
MVSERCLYKRANALALAKKSGTLSVTESFSYLIRLLTMTPIRIFWKIAHHLQQTDKRRTENAKGNC